MFCTVLSCFPCAGLLNCLFRVFQGLYKLQMIREAQRLCPDVVIVLGEDLTQFRDVSKELYQFLRDFSWNGLVERLGFDEVCAYICVT